MYGYNSTIKRKKKECKRCGKSVFIFSNGMCKECATIERVMNDIEKESEKEIEDEGLSDLIKKADEVYSKWLRLSSSDKEGFVTCYTCGSRLRWTAAQCGHYVKRGNLFLRFDPRNTRVQDENCNVYKDGNYPEFTKRLEQDFPGITEILHQEATLVYKPTRQEIKNIISEYTIKLTQIKLSRKE